MKIAVCVKAVPEQRRLDPGTKRLDRSGELALSSFDPQPIEEALRIKERVGETGVGSTEPAESAGTGSAGAGAGNIEVVLVSLGPEKAADALRKGLAMGADRAVLVADEGAAGSDLLGTAAALAAVLERESADLVLFGQQSGDGEGAVLWAAVAEKLRRPVISQVAELTVENGSVRGKRQTEFGYDLIEAALPAVIAVSDAINEPRYPSLKGIMGAKRKPQDTVSLADLGVEAGESAAQTEVYELSPPPSRGETRKIEDDGTAAEQIVAYLAEKRLV